MKYAVIDDYGDNWENGDVVYSSNSLYDAKQWAEDENYHSASIVIIYSNGERELASQGKARYDW